MNEFKFSGETAEPEVIEPHFWLGVTRHLKEQGREATVVPCADLQNLISQAAERPEMLTPPGALCLRQMFARVNEHYMYTHQAFPIAVQDLEILAAMAINARQASQTIQTVPSLVFS